MPLANCDPADILFTEIRFAGKESEVNLSQICQGKVKKQMNFVSQTLNKAHNVGKKEGLMQV
jgi:hypothetical protein